MDYATNFMGMWFLTGLARPIQSFIGEYTTWLVLVSFGFASFGSYAGLVISQQVVSIKSTLGKGLWVAAGACAMGGGVWSMHFLGMQAYSLPVEVKYDIALTALSVTPSVLASAIALFILSKAEVKRVSLIVGGVLMGAGIGVMHFTGMAAMRLDAFMAYDPRLFVLSISIAVLLAYVALSVRFELIKTHISVKWSNALAAIIMGLAISGMHYIAMGAVHFYPGSMPGVTTPTIEDKFIVVVVNVFMFLVISLVLFAAIARNYLSNSTLLNAIIDNSLEGLIVIDGKGAITLFSPAAEQIFGYAADEALGENISMLIPHRIQSMHPQYIADQTLGDDGNIMGRNREVTALAKSGIEIPVEVSVSRLSIGREVRFSATVRDIREHKEAERTMQRAHDELASALVKQKELNEAQQQFVAMASHEFRTPLAIIDMAAQRLMRHKDKLTSDDVITRMETVRDAVKRMTELMESTLSAASMDSGKIRIEIADCQLRSVVQRACDRQTEVASAHSIICDLRNLPETIRADAAALDQVLTNLLSNAVKYAPNSHEIFVKGWREDLDAMISVRDHGLGMDEDDLANLFNRFFRAKTSEGIPGTGIGLNLIKHLTEEHGGTITVQSVKGQGSVFTVRLPIKGPDKRDDAMKAATTRHLS